MTSSRKPGLVLPVAVILTVLLGLYVGAYCWLVVPVHPIRDGAWPVTADYRLIEPHPLRLMRPQASIWSRLFSPLEWLDRRVRPHVWEPK